MDSADYWNNPDMWNSIHSECLKMKDEFKELGYRPDGLKVQAGKSWPEWNEPIDSRRQ